MSAGTTSLVVRIYIDQRRIGLSRGRVAAQAARATKAGGMSFGFGIFGLVAGPSTIETISLWDRTRTARAQRRTRPHRYLRRLAD
jgi:hypothetical protein